ncbi:MAG: MaoC family dehydratase [Gammaproteobacteria bacterium]
MSKITIEDLQARIGEELGVSDWIDVGQERINQFAEVTEDRQFIHLDVEAASKTSFGGTIAHGFLTLSLLSKLLGDIEFAPHNTLMAINYGADKLRFLAPVPSGSRIRARMVLMEIVNKRPNHYMIRGGITVEIEGSDKPALSVESLSLFVLG